MHLFNARKISRTPNYYLAIFVIGLAAIQCEDDGGDESTFSYFSSSCKHEPIVSVEDDLHTTLEGDCTGLQCISWECDVSGNMSIDLINFPGACVSRYEGNAVVSGEVLEIVLDNPGCETFACDGCRFDWSFSSIDTGEATRLLVGIGEDACPEDDWDGNTYTYQIETDALNDGIVCKYISPAELIAGEDGDIYHHCVGGTSCKGDLKCTYLSSISTQLCLSPCQTYEECPFPQIMNCEDNGCVLSTEW